MIDFRSGREPKSSSFDYISIRIASPEEIRGPRDPKERERLALQGSRYWWSWGEVTKPETINYRSFKPEKDGLFCERIFGPVKDWECHCGKYKRIRYRGVICDRCGVEVTLSKVRRERMGHIELSVPVAHIWFFKTLPSPMGNLIDITLKELERVLYYSSYIVLDPGKQEVEEKERLDEDEYRALRMKARDENDAAFRAEIGAPAVRELLRRLERHGRHRDLDHPVRRQRAVLQRVGLIAGLLEVALVERVGVDEDRPPLDQLVDVGPQRGGVHRDQDVGCIAGRRDVVVGELHLERRGRRLGPAGGRGARAGSRGWRRSPCSRASRSSGRSSRRSRGSRRTGPSPPSRCSRRASRSCGSCPIAGGRCSAACS